MWPFTSEKLTKLTNCINNSKSEGLFPDSVKRANVAPVHKNISPLDKENYRSFSLKFMKRLYLINCLSTCKIFLSKILFGFNKAHSTHYALSKNNFEHGKENLINLVM